MSLRHNILESLNTDIKEEIYYQANNAERELFKLKELINDESFLTRLEKIIVELNNIRMELYRSDNLNEEAKYSIDVDAYNTSEDGDTMNRESKTYTIVADNQKEAEYEALNRAKEDYPDKGSYNITQVHTSDIDKYTDSDVEKAVEIIKSYAETHYIQNGYYTKSSAEEVERLVNTFILNNK